MSKDERKQIYNKVLLFAFSSAVSPQQQFQTINVPFNVGKVVVHPLTRYVATADVKTDCYVLQCLDINPEGTGVVGVFCGDDTTATNSKVMKFTYKQGKTFNGQHMFYLRSLAEAAGGATAPITAKVFVNIEFHEL